MLSPRITQQTPDTVLRVVEAECSLTAVGIATYIEFRRPGRCGVTVAELAEFDEPGLLEALGELLDHGLIVEDERGDLVFTDTNGDADDDTGDETEAAGRAGRRRRAVSTPDVELVEALAVAHRVAVLAETDPTAPLIVATRAALEVADARRAAAGPAGSPASRCTAGTAGGGLAGRSSGSRPQSRPPAAPSRARPPRRPPRPPPVRSSPSTAKEARTRL